MTVTRFDKIWISANRDDIFYEFNRQDGTLSFASATTKNTVTSTIVGSGRCSEVSTTSRGGDWLLTSAAGLIIGGIWYAIHSISPLLLSSNP